jgi:hypothetical protein
MVVYVALSFTTYVNVTASQQELLKHVVNKMKNGRFVRIDYFFTLVCENDQV